MNPETLEALQASIAHWERMRDRWKYGKDKPVSEQCALCKRFDDDETLSTRCCLDGEKCPVYAKTGETSCYRTPYHEAWNAWKGYDLVTFIQAAQAEIDFLRSLLP